MCIWRETPTVVVRTNIADSLPKKMRERENKKRTDMIVRTMQAI